MEKLKNMWTGVKPVQVLPIGFLAVILIGAFLLMLPISVEGDNLSFLQAIFTATSATCVTGLVVVDTGTYFTSFGQFVILLMIQLGGLGFMTVATFLFIAMGKRISLKERMTMAESLGESRLQGIIKLAINVLKMTFLLEFIGALLLSIRFIPLYGLFKGVWYSLFHSVSAFCNAGFDLIGNYTSFTGFVSDPIINFTVMFLVIIGGLGFAVIVDVIRKRSFVNLRIHTKLVLIMTGVLIFGGSLLFLLLEFNNPETLGVLSFPQKILAATFQSVTTRTAGFNTISQIGLTDASKFLSIIFMFIGGSPAGTAGGIKTSTVAVLVMIVFSLMRKHDDVEAFKKRVSINVLRKSLAIFFIALTTLIIAVMIISTGEKGTIVKDVGFLNQLFEATSAIGTVGLSTGVTGNATSLTLSVLIVLMFLGRVGLLTVVFALGSKAEESRIKYPEEDVMVG
ncbi:MAG: TrkH family potassium uptake protein [Erysipelotrichaceae bacterium]|nr:TrkH family potassium uptake protein [Erysipelotrichaceae bacterium]